MRLRHALVLAALLAIPGLYADVTLRYKTEVKLNPEAVDTATETLLQFKNGKGFTSQGALTSIYDSGKGEIALLDREGKRYATLPNAQFQQEITAAMPQMPKEARAVLDSMKTHAESKATGRTATIQGIEAEEREITMTMEAGPMPNLPAPAGPMMRMVIHCWTAKAGEVMRNAAIREIAGYTRAAMSLAVGVCPMRAQFDLFMPMIGAMMKQAPPGRSPFGPNFDPDAAFIQMSQEVAELSNGPVPDSVFEIPKDYQAASVAEIMKDIVQKRQDAIRKTQEAK